MAKQILVKPLITEKSDAMTESLGKYSFIVAKESNKVEIGKAIKAMYDVEVASVNTIRMPGKKRSRNTRSGVQIGRKSAYKKAIVTLKEGQEIDFFGEA